MKCNVGTGDKVFRIIVGLIILISGFFYESWWGLIGIIPVATALLGWCPAYLPCGITTCKTENEQKS